MLHRKGSRFVGGLVSVFLLGSICIHAQVTGTISGFVTDPTGAAVPQAKVTATLVAQNVTRSAETNDLGYYVFNALSPGEYSLAVEHTGFQRLVRPGIALAVNQNLRVDAPLTLGQVAESVEVTGAAPLVDTHSPTLSGLVDDRRVVDLPLNGRNVISLAATLPGVLSVVAPQQLSDSRSGPLMNVNGSATTQNMFTFNGGIFVHPSRNTGLNYPPPDALREFSILTQSFSAEYGRNAGSQVNVVSKSGTNEFHGSAWEFLRNNHLNARNFFASRVPTKIQNQFGAAAGAPIVKDKLFVFGTYQGLRDRGEAVGISSDVPAPAQRAGDFTSLSTALVNPIDTVTRQPFTDPSGRPCVAGNVVSQGCITTMAKSLLPMVPISPNNRVTVLDPQPRNGDMFMARGDWIFTPRNTISGQVFLDRNRQTRPQLVSGNVAGYLGTFTNQQTTTTVLNATSTISPSLLNLFTATFLRVVHESNADDTVTHDKIGVSMPFYPPTGRLGVSITGGPTFGSRSIYEHVSNNWQVRDQISWTRGRHNLKFGGEWLHLTNLQIFLGSTSMAFNGSRTGNAMADFLIGAFRTTSGGFGVRTNDNYQNAPSVFFQDEFKVAPRLTLSYGVRYEPFFPWVDKYDRLTSLKYVGTNRQSTRIPDAPPGVLFAGDPGVPRGISESDLNNFAPRFGLAWDVRGDGRTSLRASYGIFYDYVKADSVSQEGAPWAGSFQLFDGRAENPFGSLGRVPPPVVPGDSFGCAPSSSFPGVACSLFPLPMAGLFISSDITTPYIQSWNLTVQRQVTSDIMVQGAYIGKIGTHLDGWWSPNAARYITDPITGAPPSLQNVNNRVSNSPGILASQVYELATHFRSWYHGVQAQVVKRFASGFSFSGSYSLGKSIDIVRQNIGNWPLANPFDMRSNRGRSDFDRRHAFVASWLWTPQWKMGSAVPRFFLENWTLTGIHTLQSGAPFTIYMGDDVAQDGVSSGQQHGMLKPGAVVTREHSSRADMIAKFFNTDAFIPTNQVPRGVYGDSGRNIISGPGQSNTDFSAIKDFTITDRYRVQFRSEFFNIFNQVRLGCRDTTWGCSDPVATVNSASFGQIRSAGPAREIQFALKFLW